MAQSSIFALCFVLLSSLVFASPLNFVKLTEGTGFRGRKMIGLNRVKTILADLGYLDNRHMGDKPSVTNDEFDESLEKALKTYQLNYHLTPTGSLDAKTVATMMLPRCGVPDIVDRMNLMQNSQNKDYKSFSANHPKWPMSKSHFTYFIPSTMSTKAVRAIERAFEKWAQETHFTFSQTQNDENADLKISFNTKNDIHGDNILFDGPGRVVTHVVGPRLHFNGDESWSGLVQGGSVDFDTVALHGIGHLLGLSHSSVEDSIMHPSFAPGMNKGIHADDVKNIKSMYHN